MCVCVRVCESECACVCLCVYVYVSVCVRGVCGGDRMCVVQRGYQSENGH